MDEKQAADILSEEWKYRHGIWWSAFSRWTGIMVGLWVIPFLRPEIFWARPKAALCFPGIAFILSFFSVWHLSAEYGRMKMVRERLTDLLGNYQPGCMRRDTIVARLVALPIGQTIVWIHGIAFAGISLIILWLLC